MDRRDFVKSLFKSPQENRLLNNLTPEENTLDEYEGVWDYKAASHLLRRLLFGYTNDFLNESIEIGLGKTVDHLLNTKEELPDPPRKFYTDDMIGDGIEFGDYYHNKPLVSGAEVTRTNGVQMWWLMQIHQQKFTLREKMTLFWHNHFGTRTKSVEYGRFQYNTNTLYRENALGNFKDLVYKVTHDNTMMLFINGNENIVGQANENYARELFELFTVGKGEFKGDGNYTNYSEHDILEAAKVLTGWWFSIHSPYIKDHVVNFFDGLHDFTRKEFSPIFDNQVIEGTGADEYDQLIDMIFRQEATSKFIVRKLYKWFLFYDITEEVELNIIEPLAKILRDNNYEIKPVLERFFKSKHFYDKAFRGSMIKSPIDFISDLMKSTDVDIIQGEFENEDPLRTKYLAYLNNYLYFCSRLGQPPGNPTSVAGYEAYYQAPGYYKIWLSSTTLPFRMKICNDIFSYSGTDTERPVYASPLNFLSDHSDAGNPDKLIEYLLNRFIAVELHGNIIKDLKKYLIPVGQKDYVWTKAWMQYKNEPKNEIFKSSVEQKLNNLMQAITKLPEYHLM